MRIELGVLLEGYPLLLQVEVVLSQHLLDQLSLIVGLEVCEGVMDAFSVLQ